LQVNRPSQAASEEAHTNPKVFFPDVSRCRVCVCVCVRARVCVCVCMCVLTDIISGLCPPSAGSRGGRALAKRSLKISGIKTHAISPPAPPTPFAPSFPSPTDDQIQVKLQGGFPRGFGWSRAPPAPARSRAHSQGAYAHTDSHAHTHTLARTHLAPREAEPRPPHLSLWSPGSRQAAT
jgi:hypothetical protein